MKKTNTFPALRLQLTTRQTRMRNVTATVQRVMHKNLTALDLRFVELKDMHLPLVFDKFTALQSLSVQCLPSIQIQQIVHDLPQLLELVVYDSDECRDQSIHAPLRLDCMSQPSQLKCISVCHGVFVVSFDHTDFQHLRCLNVAVDMITLDAKAIVFPQSLVDVDIFANSLDTLDTILQRNTQIRSVCMAVRHNDTLDLPDNVFTSIFERNPSLLGLTIDTQTTFVHSRRRPCHYIEPLDGIHLQVHDVKIKCQSQSSLDFHPLTRSLQTNLNLPGNCIKYMPNLHTFHDYNWWILDHAPVSLSNVTLPSLRSLRTCNCELVHLISANLIELDLPHIWSLANVPRIQAPKLRSLKLWIEGTNYMKDYLSALIVAPLLVTLSVRLNDYHAHSLNIVLADMNMPFLQHLVIIKMRKRVYNLGVTKVDVSGMNHMHIVDCNKVQVHSNDAHQLSRIRIIDNIEARDEEKMVRGCVKSQYARCWC